MTKRDRRSEGLPSLDGSSVHVVGPRVFQNALLANILTAATGVVCHLYGTGEALDEPPTADRRRHLVLEDYLGLETRDFDGSPMRDPPTGVPRTLVALFNLPGDWGRESTALRRGLRGFFYENDAPETLVKGVRHIFGGELWVSRKAIAASFEAVDEGRAAKRAQREGLTLREQEILRSIAEGDSNEMVAERMRISSHTVKTHLYNAYQKIGVKNRTQAARWAARNLA